MKCNNCGAPLQLNQKFCPNCGSPNEQVAEANRAFAHFRF